MVQKIKKVGFIFLLKKKPALTYLKKGKKGDKPFHEFIELKCSWSNHKSVILSDEIYTS